jgi:hypothetical protein
MGMDAEDLTNQIIADVRLDPLSRLVIYIHNGACDPPR